MRLSPLNFRNLLEREVFSYAPEPEMKEDGGKRMSARRVHGYECPVCGDFGYDKEEAEECCQGPAGDPTKDDEYAKLCPVCGLEGYSAIDASDCCLWKDIDQPTRHALAGRVEQGSTWARELGVWPPVIKEPA